MKTLGRVLGAIGLVLVVPVPLVYFGVGGGWNWMFTVQVSVGTAFVAAYFITNVDQIGKIATGRGTFFVVFSAIATIVVVAIVAAGDYVAVQTDVTKDLTKAKLFTLAPQSVKVAESLKKPVDLLAFYRSDSGDYQGLKNLVARYLQHTKMLKLRSIDPDREPMLVKKYKVNLRGNRIVAVLGNREQKVTQLSEEALTNALVKLTHGAAKQVYFTVGHGEEALDDKTTPRGLDLMKIAMDNEGLDAAKLSLVDVKAVPTDAAAVVIAGPQRPFLPAEVTLLESYLEGGGRLMVMLDPGVNAGLDSLLAKYGIQADDDLVLDQNRLAQILGTGPAVPLVRQYAKVPITKDFDIATIFPTARSLTALSVPGVKRPIPVALTSGTAWGESDYKHPPYKYDDGEKRGPLALMVQTTKKKPSGTYSKQMRLVVFGDADFASHKWAAQLGNADLFLNTLNWLASQGDRITIRPKMRSSSRIYLTENQAMFLRMFTVNFLPLSLAALGFAVFVTRKNR